MWQGFKMSGKVLDSLDTLSGEDQTNSAYTEQKHALKRGCKKLLLPPPYFLNGIALMRVSSGWLNIALIQLRKRLTCHGCQMSRSTHDPVCASVITFTFLNQIRWDTSPAIVWRNLPGQADRFFGYLWDLRSTRRWLWPICKNVMW